MTISNQQSDQQIDLVCTELRKVLLELMARQAHQGQKIIIHVSGDRREMWIEKPPEVIRLRRADSRDNR